jgi:hypothetical protein
LYSGGRLCGCYGSDEGRPGERIARAFLRALEDSRGGVRPSDRARLVAQVAYLRTPHRLVSLDDALLRIEPGTHGVGFVPGDGPAAILLPQVARDGGLSARSLLETLAKKAGVALSDLARPGSALFLLEADEQVVRPPPPPQTAPPTRGLPASHAGGALDAAAAWLARLVEPDGFVPFAIDLRSRAVLRTGPMHHGRAAVVVRALAAHGAEPRTTERARDWLDDRIRAALRGRHVDGWPEDRAVVAGTLALACLAGLSLHEQLETFVGAGEALDATGWHAAQVVAALGTAAPAAAWEACIAALRARPWAPWTVVAALARGDEEVVERGAKVLEASVRPAPPHAGGVALIAVPELALSAVVVEALAPLRRPTSRIPIARACDFLRRWQLSADRAPAAIDPDLANGAFPASPVSSLARGDVTGHALLALLASARGMTARRRP